MSGSNGTDVVNGALKLLGKLDCQCFKDWQEFIKAIPSMFSVEIPDSITNVIVSNNQPDDDQHDNIWFRLNAAGTFVGIYIYGAGDWRQVWPAPNQIIRMYGDSRNIPTGYLLADEYNPNLTQSQAQALQTQWVAAPDGSGAYSIFDVTYQGF